MKKLSALVGITMLVVAGVVVYQVNGNVFPFSSLQGELLVSSTIMSSQSIKWGCGDGTCKQVADGVFNSEPECQIYIGTASCGVGTTTPSPMPGNPPTTTNPMPSSAPMPANPPPTINPMPNVPPTLDCKDLTNPSAERRVFSYLKNGYAEKLNVDAEYNCKAQREEPPYCSTIPNCRNTIEAGQGSNLEKPVAVSYTITYGPQNNGTQNKPVWEMRYVCNYKRFCEKNTIVKSSPSTSSPMTANYCCSKTTPKSCVLYPSGSLSQYCSTENGTYTGKDYNACVTKCSLMTQP